MLPGMAGRTWLVPVCEMFQSCSSGSVVCCSYSGVCPFFQQSHDSQDAERERNCRVRSSFELPRCLFCICFGFISLIVGFSLILYFMYGLFKLRLPQQRVLAYLLPALCECFGMYSPTKEWFVAWHFSDALTDFDLAVLLVAAPLKGLPALKQQLVLCCCVFSFHGYSFLWGAPQDLFNQSSPCPHCRMLRRENYGHCLP